MERGRETADRCLCEALRSRLELMVLLSSRRSLLIRLVIVIVCLAGRGILGSAALEGAKLKETIGKLRQHTIHTKHEEARR